MLGEMRFKIDSLIEFLKKYNEKHRSRVTISHIVGKAFASALNRYPHWNCSIVFGNLVQKETIDVCYLVHVEGDNDRQEKSSSSNGGRASKSVSAAPQPRKKRGVDLAKMKIERTDEKSLADIAREMHDKVSKLKENRDEDYNKTKSVLQMLPVPLLKVSLSFFGWIAGALGKEIPLLGIKEKFPFGSCIVTNVGGFNLQTAFAPVTPYAHSPVYLCVGRAQKEPVVEEQDDGSDAVVIRTILPLTATVDHRHFDGAQMGKVAEIMKKIIEQPEENVEEFNL